jgi:hypothetical protein
LVADARQNRIKSCRAQNVFSLFLGHWFQKRGLFSRRISLFSATRGGILQVAVQVGSCFWASGQESSKKIIAVSLGESVISSPPRPRLICGLTASMRNRKIGPSVETGPSFPMIVLVFGSVICFWHGRAAWLSRVKTGTREPPGTVRFCGAGTVPCCAVFGVKGDCPLLLCSSLALDGRVLACREQSRGGRGCLFVPPRAVLIIAASRGRFAIEPTRIIA